MVARWLSERRAEMHAPFGGPLASADGRAE
jgi:hypothetical protein